MPWGDAGGEHAEVREECSRAIAERDEDVRAVVGGLAGEREDARGSVEASLKQTKSENKPRYLSARLRWRTSAAASSAASTSSTRAERHRRERSRVFISNRRERRLSSAYRRAGTTGADAYSINAW